MVVWRLAPPIFPSEPFLAGGLAAAPALPGMVVATLIVDGRDAEQLELVPEPDQPGCGRLSRRGLEFLVVDVLGLPMAARYTCAMGEEGFGVVFAGDDQLSTTVFRAGGPYLLTGVGGTCCIMGLEHRWSENAPLWPRLTAGHAAPRASLCSLLPTAPH